MVCTKENPCKILIPAGDGCNQCYAYTWCDDGQWYVEETGACTAIWCGNRVSASDTMPYGVYENGTEVFK